MKCRRIRATWIWTSGYVTLLSMIGLLQGMASNWETFMIAESGYKFLTLISGYSNKWFNWIISYIFSCFWYFVLSRGHFTKQFSC